MEATCLLLQLFVVGRCYAKPQSGSRGFHYTRIFLLGRVGMVKSDLRQTACLRHALDRALRAGLSADAILSVVTEMVAIPKPPANNGNAQAYLPTFEPPGTPIFDELPPGMIDFPTASRSPEEGGYGIHLRTLHNWVRTGRITEMGRLKARAPGGGYIVVWEQDLIDYIKAPRNKGGRPIGSKSKAKRLT